MLPLYLSIEGLYSYKQRQELYFDKLTSAHLFGIFGAVGSGKSSLLEAMMLAIYGENERVNRREHHHIINLQSDKAQVVFECLVGTQKYQFVWKAKRKKDGSVEREYNVYRREANEWKPCNTEKRQDVGESIIGIKYEHFKQAIVIPQGKFREFIELGVAQRTNMLKDLFHLHRFDLSESARKLQQQEEKKLGEIRGKLSAYQDVTIEHINALTEALRQNSLRIEALQKEYRDIDVLLKSQEKARQITSEWNIIKKEWQIVEAQKADFQARKLFLSQYQKAFGFIKPLYDQYKESNNRAEIIDKKLTELTFILQNLQTEHNAKQDELLKAQQEFDKNQDRQVQIHDLQTVIVLMGIREEILALRKQEETAKIAQLASGEKVVAQKTEIDALKRTIQQLKDTQPDIRQLTEEVANAQNFNRIQTQKVDIIRKLEAIATEKHRKEQQIRQLIPDLPVVLPQVSELIEQQQATLSLLQEQIQVLSVEMSGLLLRAKLADYAAQLQEGQPCPLCGAIHHPDKYTEETTEKRLLTENQLQSLQSQLTTLTQNIKALQKIQIEIEKDLTIEESYRQQITTLDAEASQQFASTPLADVRTARLRLEQAQQHIQEITKNEKVAQQLESQLTALESDSEKHKQAHQQILSDIASKENAFNELKKTVRLLNADKILEEKTRQEVQESKRRGEEVIQNAIQTFQVVSAKVSQLQQQLTQKQTEIQELLRQRAEWAQRSQALAQQLNQAVSEQGFASLAQAQEYLKTPINIAHETEQIAEFDRKIAILTNQYETLQALQSQYPFDEQAYQQCQARHQELEQALIASREQQAVWSDKLRKTQDQLIEKLQIIEQEKTTAKRVEGFTKLASLFRGNAFVAWVAEHYLQNLISSANHRFEKLTHHSLSLQLDDKKEEILVCDHINEGKTRLLKTLSGGQMFQAALCLALSLAENVCSVHQSSQSFFFLDEGFGSLDKNALRTVFETLQSLRAENRIVGIISHVEELQQEIDVYAHIKQENGSSRIYCSWQHHGN